MGSCLASVGEVIEDHLPVLADLRIGDLDDQSDLADAYFEQLTTLTTFKLVRGANFVILKFCDGARRHSIFRDSNFPRS